jgi:uncharacterized protein (TIGR03437 family)
MSFDLHAATSWTLLGWSEFGVNSMERDYSVFAIWPPYVTLHAQLIDASGKLVTNPGAAIVTFEAMADPSGSINSTSASKTNFWSFAKALFGGSATPDMGITGTSMPTNGPQSMAFESAFNRFTAEGVPLTPYDDQWNQNYYPVMNVTARDQTGNILATARVSTPVSNEVECRGCHASGANPDAQPTTGYAYDSNPNRDFKLNILSIHDVKNLRNPAYSSSLAAAGYASSGLIATVQAGTPILCTACHASNQLSKPGIANILPLTTAMHSHHAPLTDPKTGASLDSSADRSACYNCHPGTSTHALRGAMGHSVGADGSLQIQCQNCHGNLSALANPARRGYIDMPNCQACHTTGAPRATNALDASGALRVNSDTTFATTPNQPVAGATLYRYSVGHGGLQCAACHGATHAEYESAQSNDNLQSLDLQGATGPVRDCTACHKSGVSSSSGGPHGMHQVGPSWVSQHPDIADRSRSTCQTCHGTSYQGTVLSQAFVSRTLNTDFGTIQMFRGYQVSCYTCHNGPSGSGRQGAAPSVASTSGTVGSGQAATLPVTVSGGGSLRIVSQPHGGTAHVSGNALVYMANANFEGTDQVTYAAIAGNRDSNLGTASITVNSADRPVFSAASIVNAASYAPGIAPGMIAYLGGKGLGPANLATFELNSGGFIEKSLKSTQVSFNGFTSPILWASDGALSAIVPYEIAGQSNINMVVQFNGISSATVSVPVASSVPGMFTSNASGTGQAAAVNQDGTLNSASNPASRGSIVSLYLTGDGIETPQPLDGKIAATAPWPAPAANITVSIGGQSAALQYSGAAPASVAGLMQINVTIPDGVASGPNEVVVSAGGITSAGPVTIQVR